MPTQDAVNRRTIFKAVFAALALRSRADAAGVATREDGLGSSHPLPKPSGKFLYEIRDNAFALKNGPAYFNRPLFGTHEPTMLLSGDRPAFACFAPTGIGKAGTLYIGLLSAANDLWLHQFESVDFYYSPGFTRHILADPKFGNTQLEVTAVPLSADEGFTIRLRRLTPTQEPMRLAWTFGGASGYTTNKSARVDKLHLSGEDTASNTVQALGRHFALHTKTLGGKHVEGTCSLPGQYSLRDAAQVLEGPRAAEQEMSIARPVAFFSADWPESVDTAYIIVTLAGNQRLQSLAADPTTTFDESLGFYQTRADRVLISSPDDHLNLAMKAMVIACDGSWQPPAFLHGAMSWMQHYTGWRIMYGPEALGWHDRVQAGILAHAAQQITRGDDRGRIPDVIETGGTFYNMNEVFLDELLYHYKWTGNRELLASLSSFIQGMVSWERRRLEVGGSGLYESCINTWVSDSHWYDGGYCAQASAYMHQAFRLAAEAEKAAGRDASEFAREAERTRAAINDKLWLPKRGHYAEFIDVLGRKRVHEEPELATLYHTIEFDIADPFQSYQMLRFTETSLTNETDLPNRGRLVWNSNWAPNFKEAYAHSTRDLVFAEGLNLAVAYYHAGQFDNGYDLIKGAYASMYQGAIPGGLSCHAYRNGQQRRNEEFADGISLFARVVVEGLYGIRPEFQNDLLHLCPGFPRDWREAAIRTPDVSYDFARSGNEIRIQTKVARQARIHYRIAIYDEHVVTVLLNGGETREYTVEPAVGRAFVNVTAPASDAGELVIRLRGLNRAVQFPAVVAQGDSLRIDVAGGQALSIRDPQGVLREAKNLGSSVDGSVVAEAGHRTLFLLAGDSKQSYWYPVDVEVRSRVEILAPKITDDGGCAFTLRNNGAGVTLRRIEASWAGAKQKVAGELHPGEARDFSIPGKASSLLIGENPLALSAHGIEAIVSKVPYWPENSQSRSREPWKPISLDSEFDESLETVLQRNFWSADYKYPNCFDYLLAHLNGDRSRAPNAALLRKKITADGIFETRYGIPFAQRAAGHNMVALSLWNDFRHSMEIPIDQSARRLYLLVSAITFPMQSHIANARATVCYADGTNSTLDLTNPTNLDNGSGTFGGTYHYTANGHEMIGEVPPFEYPPQPMIILRQHGVPDQDEDVHPAWENSEPMRPPLASHADIIGVDCDPAKRIHKLEVEALANNVIIGLFGVTLLP